LVLCRCGAGGRGREVRAMSRPGDSESASLTSVEGVAVQAQDEQAPPKDEYTIYQMCMRGLYDQVAKLVENGADVTVRDDENISCLHWAAINNRSDLCAYLISKGAEVDALGGELMATPLQWAVRHAHLATTRTLLQHGADPAIKDVQGYNSLHLAVQFGTQFVTHETCPAACAAYILAKTGIDVDTTDAEGRTPLMWAAIKDFQPDTARLLLGFGASINAQDNGGQTALHHAVLHSNYSACKTLVEDGARYDIASNEDKGGVTVADILYDRKRPPSMMQHLILPPAPSDPILDIVHADPTRYNLMLCLPFFGLCGIGLALEVIFQNPMKGIIFFFSVIALWTQSYMILCERASLKFPWPGMMALYLGTKVMLFLCFFYVLWPATQGPDALVGYEWDALAVLFSVGLWYNFYKAHTIDPGNITMGKMANAKSTICKLVDDQKFDKTNFCYTCCVRKPYRSKHDPYSGRCIAKFDHYCPFTGNAIGAKNHRHFLLFLICMPCLIWLYIYLAVLFMREDCGVHRSTIKTAVHYVPCQPFLCWTIANGAMHSLWVCCLLFMQLKQVADDLTTNEAMNGHRYDYLANGMSPWSRGCLRNLWYFFVPGADKTDWTKVFSLPGSLGAGWV